MAALQEITRADIVEAIRNNLNVDEEAIRSRVYGWGVPILREIGEVELDTLDNILDRLILLVLAKNTSDKETLSYIWSTKFFYLSEAVKLINWLNQSYLHDCFDSSASIEQLHSQFRI